MVAAWTVRLTSKTNKQCFEKAAPFKVFRASHVVTPVLILYIGDLKIKVAEPGLARAWLEGH